MKDKRIYGMFGPKIKAMRLEQGLKQRQFDELLGTDMPMYSKMELGARRVRRDQVPKLAELYKVEEKDLTMHLAEAAKISVVPHSLIRWADGELGYITKRIDRTKNGEKIDMEDMCQLTQHPTEYKYKGSHEQIANMYLDGTKWCLEHGRVIPLPQI